MPEINCLIIEAGGFGASTPLWLLLIGKRNLIGQCRLGKLGFRGKKAQTEHPAIFP
jgi:hypothetical protein